MKMRKRTLALIALVLALVCVSIPVFLYLLGGNNRRVKLIVVGKTSTTTVEFWRSVHDGMAEAAGDFNVEYEFISMPDESDVEGQKTLLAQAAKSAPDAIVWIAADYEMAEEAAALSETGIPFVLMDSDVNYTGGSKKSFVGTDNYAAALAAGLRAGDGRYGRKAAILVHVHIPRPVRTARADSGRAFSPMRATRSSKCWTAETQPRLRGSRPKKSLPNIPTWTLS